MGIWEGSLGHEFLRGSMRAEGMVMGGSGLDGYFGEQRLPVDIRECLKIISPLCECSVHKYLIVFLQLF